MHQQYQRQEHFQFTNDIYDNDLRPTMTEADPAIPPAMKSCMALISALVLAVVVAPLPGPLPLSLPSILVDVAPPWLLLPVIWDGRGDDDDDALDLVK